MLSKVETHQLFGKLREQEQKEARYELAARLQYGAGLRLSELVRLRVQNIDVKRETQSCGERGGKRGVPWDDHFGIVGRSASGFHCRQ